MDEVALDLALATRALPPEIRHWLGSALSQHSYRIGAFSYENDPTVCPIVAGAKAAGLWLDGGVAPGHPLWGTPDAPSTPVEEFAARFDLCTERHGAASALQNVRDTLQLDLIREAA